MNNQKLRAVLSSRDQQELQILRKVLKDCNYQSEIVLFDLEETQFMADKKMIQSARSQVKSLQREFPSYGLFVAIQQGTVKKFGILFMEIWCYAMRIISKDDDNECITSFGVSSGIKVPDVITAVMQAQDMSFEKAIKLAQFKHNSKDSAAQLFTGDIISQFTLIEEAMRNAIIPLLSDGLYEHESSNPQISSAT